MFYTTYRAQLVNVKSFYKACGKALSPKASSSTNEVQFIGSKRSSIRPPLLSSCTSRSALMPIAKIQKAKEHATIANREKEKNVGSSYRVDPHGKKEHHFHIDIYIVHIDRSYTRLPARG